MSVNRVIRIIAGFFVVLSLVLGVEKSPLFINENFLYFTLFVGVMLFQSGFTQLCPMEWIVKKCGAKDSTGSCC